MTESLLSPGHTACAGCGEALGMKLIINAAGPNVIIANATGCSEIFTSRYPESAWQVPWIHSLFENTAAVASGIEAALKALGRETEAHVIAQGGDGGMADIGFGALSGMFERGHNILAITLDNEAYMNTGIQRSGLTPLDARTSTSPPGELSWGNITPKKDMPQIAVAHGIPYVATATVGYFRDLEKKVKKALAVKGPKYLQVLVPCPLGWQHDPSLTIRISKLAVETCIFPLIEIENGKLTEVVKVSAKKPVEEYLKLQGRYKHLFAKEGGKEEITKIQSIADENARKYGLV
ncbi:MAG: thiamine pyrophosphate-dependent enzyme [Candidatus Omnitrophota bacterium]